ncbi:titin-like, partial [Astyanax mexicanus]
EKQQKPHFKKKLTSVRLKQFGPVHFECRLTPIGDPTMIVEWLHDGKPLEAANRLRMVNEFGYCSLDYEAAYARDSGVITCRATNKFGIDQTSATLLVREGKGLVEETQLPEGRSAQRIDEIKRLAHEGPSGVSGEEVTEKIKPEIVLLPEPVRVLEGETAKFRCRVTGYPAPKVNWYLNGLLVLKSKRFRLLFDGIHYLEVVDCKSYDAGEMKVLAENPEGVIEHTVKFEVQQKEDFRTVLRQTKGPAPCTVGGNAVFEYRVTGVPLPSVQWLKDSCHIQPGKFCNMVNNVDGSGFLKIINVQKNDSGLYSCRASNLRGEASCSADLIVFLGTNYKCWT